MYRIDSAYLYTSMGISNAQIVQVYGDLASKNKFGGIFFFFVFFS